MTGRWRRRGPDGAPEQLDDYTRRRQLKYRASVFLFAGAVCLLACLLAIGVHLRFAMNGAVADAVVVGYDEGSRERSRAIIEFRTKAGTIARTPHPSWLTIVHPAVGEHLLIAYDPDRLERVGFANWSDDLPGIVVLFAFAAAWSVPGVLSFRAMRRIPRTEAKAWRRHGKGPQGAQAKRES